ncbi:MAG: MBL fold metallo-hydrolase [Bacteroidales bacterium]|nr:MBL fold metallo-hydrolase [Bacteroidales bacterium]
MKILSLIIILTGLWISSLGQETTKIERISDDLYYSEIMDSTYVIIHKFPGKCNSMFVLVGDNKGVLIDTPDETTGTKSLVEWINTKFGDIELFAINTGFHYDNAGGNEYLYSKGIKIYGASLTARLIEENAIKSKENVLEYTSKKEDKKYFQAFSKVNFLPPTDTFAINNGLNLNINGETFDIYFPGESHTIDNVVVYLKNKKVLFGGCMILSMNHKRPGYIADANMIEWPKSVEIVKDRFKDTKIVIPGHGDWGDTQLLSRTIDILNKWNTENINP